MKTGFDSEKYLKIQTEKIEERIKMFDKLYLEFGGKIFDDPGGIVNAACIERLVYHKQTSFDNFCE